MSRCSGALNRDQFELLLMAVGYNVTSRELDACLSDLGVRAGESVGFALFFDWWTSSVGAKLLKRK